MATGLFGPTSVLAFEIGLRVVNALVLVSVLYYGFVYSAPYRVTSKETVGGVRGTLFLPNHLYHLPMTVLIGHGMRYQLGQKMGYAVVRGRFPA